LAAEPLIIIIIIIIIVKLIIIRNRQFWGYLRLSRVSLAPCWDLWFQHCIRFQLTQMKCLKSENYNIYIIITHMKYSSTAFLKLWLAVCQFEN
jgi:hypothetical protein